jgi:hypothetical protein
MYALLKLSLGLFMEWHGPRIFMYALLKLRPCLVSKNFQDSSSHQIFGRMHEALNIDENKN